MYTQSIALGRVVMARLDPGEDLLQAIGRAAAENSVANGLILNGVGSINRYHVHVVALPTLPTRDEFIWGEGAFDILSLSGLVIAGRVHAHITLANEQGALGGHLEEGTRILTFAVVTLGDVGDVDLTGWDSVGRLEDIISNK